MILYEIFELCWKLMVPTGRVSVKLLVLMRQRTPFIIEKAAKRRASESTEPDQVWKRYTKMEYD